MGKKSLIKSTTKKKSAAKEGEEKATKKTAVKKTKKAKSPSAKKTAAKSTKATTTKTAKKTTAKKAAPKKAAAKKTTKAKAKPKAAPKKSTKAVKKISIKDLVFKRFEPATSAPAPITVPKPAPPNVSAPALIDSTDPKQAERQRALLFNKYSMDEIKAVAKAPEPPKPKVKEPENTAAVEKTAHSEPSEPAVPPTAQPQAEPSSEESTVEKTPPSEPSEPAEAPTSQTPSNHPSEPSTDDAYITIPPNKADGDNGAIGRSAKIAIAAAAIFVLVLLSISYNNGSKYYIYPKDDAIEIWKGDFSPKDTIYFMTLNDLKIDEPVKEVYTKGEVYPLIMDYYLKKADALLEEPGLPNLEAIKNHLDQAEPFIVNKEMETKVISRKNTIDRMVLLYKADVAISNNTQDSIASAIKLLKKAKKLTPSEALAEEISKKIEKAREQAVILKSKAKEAKKEAKKAEKAEDEAGSKTDPKATH